MSGPPVRDLLALTISSPSGAAWEFLVLFLVVIIGPPLLERSRLPGIIGLLLGGFVIGPNCLDVIGAGNTTVPELGQVGLLYLMFVAGLELDLAVLRVHRRWVVLFATVSFLLPMTFGSALGFSLSWNAPAAILLGALLASHTLLTYPAVRQAGLATNLAAATAVGATVLTDTASLIVLAAVSGTQVSGGSAASIGGQVVFGLAVVAIFSMVLLPRIVRIGFRYLGTDRVVRYLLAVASFLAAATVADVVGIEGIVGAFFAGLGLNRLIPNEGPLMERIDFFGTAVFVPVFLVSVGMLLKPSVMFQVETLKLAALFTVATISGKSLACLIVKRPMRISASESVLMLGLTVPQAAATLAATVVGFNIGLFSQTVVNAVLVVILITIVTATLLVDRAKRSVTVAGPSTEALGKRLLVALDDPALAPIGFSIAARIAAPDSGVVRGLLRSPPHDTAARESDLTRLQTAGYAVGLDVDPQLLVHPAFAEGIVNVVAAQRPSFVLVGQREAASAHLVLGSVGEAVAASIPIPVAIVIGDATKLGDVVLVEPTFGPEATRDGYGTLTSELAQRIGGKRVERRQTASALAFSDAEPGQLWVAPAQRVQVLAAADLPKGVAVLMVFDSVNGLQGAVDGLGGITN